MGCVLQQVSVPIPEEVSMATESLIHVVYIPIHATDDV